MRQKVTTITVVTDIDATAQEVLHAITTSIKKTFGVFDTLPNYIEPLVPITERGATGVISVRTL